ncbi:cryptochrome/photolyase family protein [Tenacibaculum sp. nBUS_03]|uniref:cryptochrome/photolyase family protein n=1 Tax=Tenacibaculum sp. nBUS_03 TaxID=3395320 RepID=UPI003EBFA405
MKTLRLILGDQLNIKHSWFKEINEDVLYCMFEIKQEATYVKQHIQKIAGFFGAMRDFSSQLQEKGHNIIYYKINDKNNSHSFKNNILQIAEERDIKNFEYQYPDEYRINEELLTCASKLKIASKVVSSEHFYTEREELSVFFKDKKQTVMETFYQYMRKKHQVLMENNKPVGGKWNYDKSNRKKWKEDSFIPLPYEIKHDVSEILAEVNGVGIETFGNINDTFFNYPLNREEALGQLNYFVKELLPLFGDYQDAMHDREVYLYHSKLSFALNIKLITPKEVVDKVEKSYYKNNTIGISQAEGFIRQILGWREFMRGMYWKLMPTFKKTNFFGHQNALPDFFWTGKTKMNCVKNCLKNSLDNSYAHHIQRLMVLGNLALLLEVDPEEVDKWYLGVYIDAVEWVQLPNTRGMSQYADGGLIATKPYVSSANYIDKMSNYCSDCSYDKKDKISTKACPFNSLYWNFLATKQEELKKNRRMFMMFNLLNKMDSDLLMSLKSRANSIINSPDNY